MIYPDHAPADRPAVSPETGGKIAPCPYSPRFQMEAATAWKSLTVFWFYRLIVAGVMVNLYLNQALPSSLDRVRDDLFAPATLIYLGAILAAGGLLVLRRPGYGPQAQLQVFADIALLPFVIHASGGLSSGAGVLLGMSVAAGGILVGGRCALLFAALATLAVLIEEVYTDLNGAFDRVHYTYGGLLGASFFAIALLALELARMAERSQEVAEQRGADIVNLQQINEHVIRNLETGILVADTGGVIHVFNEAAVRLLPTLKAGNLEAANASLAQLFREWLADHGGQMLALAQEGRADLNVRFSRLGLTRPPLYMIDLEDSATHNRRVQLSKLASLGRLTASIAHEIRNPLGAISHASQLLAESPALAGQDLRLIQIILDHSARLNTVVENVLQISRRSEARREILRLKAAVDKFLADFKASHALPPADFRLVSDAGNPEVAFDPTHLQQILENLCSNALKYGRPELGPIVVRIVRRQGEVCVEVVDHAPPIDRETAANLFEPFFTTAASGTGLGLYIARELAELNRSRLEYADSGDGPCFRLCLLEAGTSLAA